MKKLSYIAYTLLFGCVVALLTSCGYKIPEKYSESDELPTIYPDYTNVTVPINIAPLTFEFDGKVEDMVARFSVGNEELVLGGDKIQPDADDWKRLVEKAKGDSIKVEVYVEKNDHWIRFKPFSIYVSPDPIDPYISYRLISPSYVTYEELTISQRCLENYNESVIYDNMLCSENANGQCINCHNYQQYNPDRMQFHARQNLGGTVIAYDGNIQKINMTGDSILSAGVYPTWHPTLKLIVYSTNKTAQIFHSVDPNKIEVFDTESDLIAYDVEKNEVTNIENDPNEMECFPFWAPDGKTLYYCSAHFEYNDSIDDKGKDVIMRTDEIKYNLYKKSFNPETMQFGPRELVWEAPSNLTAPSNLPPTGEAGPADEVTSEASPLGGGMVGASEASSSGGGLDGVSGASPVGGRLEGAASSPSGGGSVGASATLPRISPDGRFLMFTLAKSGVFHIWHHDADLWLIDLQTGKARNMEEINSPDTESYHSWSSNGRWVIFSSRRYDGNYTRPFIAHIDANGRGSKPFELPCADPDYHRQFLKCYNIPEFMKGPVTISPQRFADVLKQEAKPVKYVNRLHK